jgi:CheY-like chemotaxis protein
LEICQGDIESKQISISQSLWAEQHHIWADPARIQQVFWNLINNAVKFTPKGGQISLRTWNESHVDEQGETKVRMNVEISDTGVGIAPEVLPRIFSAFEQGERTVTREFGGLGLGLAISRALARMHKAVLTAHSEGQNRGSTFTLSCDAVESHQALESPTPLPMNRKSESQQRILLVEDHEDTLRMMQKLLTMFGYRVQTANSVKSARDLAEQATFDLIISDIGLPDGSGLDVMQHFRDRHETKGIALSGFGMEEDLRRSREAGFARHLTKPVNLQTLQQTIDEVLA